MPYSYILKRVARFCFDKHIPGVVGVGGIRYGVESVTANRNFLCEGFFFFFFPFRVFSDGILGYFLYTSVR